MSARTNSNASGVWWDRRPDWGEACNSASCCPLAAISAADRCGGYFDCLILLSHFFRRGSGRHWPRPLPPFPAYWRSLLCGFVSSRQQDRGASGDSI